MFTPPDFLSFGIPPANSPPSWGGPADEAPVSPPSLLLLALAPLGTGGANPPGVGLGAIPGTGGAPAGLTGAASTTLPIDGAERSFIWPTFLSLAPPSILLSSAPCFVSEKWNKCSSLTYSSGSFNSGRTTWKTSWGRWWRWTASSHAR